MDRFKELKMKKIIKKLKAYYKHLIWLEQERIKAMIKSGKGFN